MSDQPRHPGYGPTPPGGSGPAGPGPQSGQPWPPQQPPQAPPSYQQAPQQPHHPGYGPQPGSGYGEQPRHPGYGPGQPYGQPGPGKPRNTLGLVAVILAGVAVVLGFFLTILQALVPYTAGAYGVISGLDAVLRGLLGVGAVVFGVLGMRRRDGGVVLSAMGFGAGVVLVIGTLTSLLYPLLFRISYDY